MTTEAPKPASDESVTPASDEEVASVEPNIAKTAWETCSNCDAGLRSINVPPYLEGTHEDYCILTMWPKVIARIEHEQAANAELRAEGQKLKTAIDDLKRTVTEASMRRAGTPQAQTTTYAYFADDLLRQTLDPNGVSADRTYDKADRLKTLANTMAATLVSSYAYGYDTNGNRTSQVETLPPPITTPPVTPAPPAVQETAVENRVWDLDASLADHKASFAIERAARERVEARAKELEDLILAEACNDGECITVPHANKVCAEARAILAARKGESNG